MASPSLSVALRRSRDYAERAILADLDAVWTALDLSRRWHGRTVLLKPNLISTRGPSYACTHPVFVAALAGWFLEHGARVLLGDSPAFGSAAAVLAKKGISAALRGMPVEVVEFATPRRVALAAGSLRVAEEALGTDLFVGLPKVKAHQQLLVTLAVKNLFGIVTGIDKALLHMRHGSSHGRFAGLILDLLPLLPAQLHLADGIEAMHRSGPLDGDPLALHCLAAATSAPALDSALLAALEVDPQRSPLARLATERGLAGSDAAALHYPLLAPTAFHGAGFLVPERLEPIRFRPTRFLRRWGRTVVSCCLPQKSR